MSQGDGLVGQEVSHGCVRMFNEDVIDSISVCGSALGSSSRGKVTLRDCAIGGSTLILLFGTLLFVASLGPARPF
ncbi:MAG: hypothetical protein WBW08_07150 [Methyloceanibacter sp.]